MKKLTEWIEDELKPLLWVITRGDVRRCQIKIYIIPRLEIYIPYVQRDAYWESKLKKLILAPIPAFLAISAALIPNLSKVKSNARL